MGRKPNQLILEFFERGPKLEDASNRYQHTCKSCGEKFPKGRIDSLTKHLVSKCPALPLRDRQRAILQFHELPDLPENSNQTNAQNGQTYTLPYTANQNMSALETLAEVSRRHLDLTGKGAAGKGGRRASKQQTVAANHNGAFEEFIVQDDKPSEMEMTGMGPGDSSSAPALPSIYNYGNVQTPPSGSPHLPGLSIPQNNTATSQVSNSPLILAASAANELQNMMPNGGLPIEPELGVSNAGITDKFFHPQGGQRTGFPNNAIDPMLREHSREPSVGQEVSLARSPVYNRPLAAGANPNQTQFTTDFSLNQRPMKPKVRGRFSDTRRKQVQEVRKRGACIRCRMLKKPCSGDSPCFTCKNVESARLWKQPCIRTRIAEEFDLYSAGLHTVLAFHAVNQAKAQTPLEHVPGRIEATQHPETSTYATFGVLKGQKARSSAIDPALLDSGETAGQSYTDLQMLDSDSDDLGGKLEYFIQKMAPTYFETEVSRFMKTTLLTAWSMNRENKDDLLGRVLELWIVTVILVDKSKRWHFFYNPGQAPALSPASISSAELETTPDSAPSRVEITQSLNPESYDLAVVQLQGATEKRAATLSKYVMNELERRLLQRQQAKPFETFLVAVILLACVERMCWFYKTWEQAMGLPTNETSDTNDVNNANEANEGNDADDANDTNTAMHDEPSDLVNLEETKMAEALAPVIQENQNSLATGANDGSNEDPNNQQRQTKDHTASTTSPDAENRPQPNAPSLNKWPLDRQPPYYSQQGERFSDILHMLLKMRGVPPKCGVRPSDGVILVQGDPTLESSSSPQPAVTANTTNKKPSSNSQQAKSESGANVNASADAEDQGPREWFEAVAVTTGTLARRQAARFEGERPQEWELKYVGKILGAGLV